MKHRHLGERVLARIDRGEELLGALTALCKTHEIHGGSLTGIGAVEAVELGYYDLETFTYRTRALQGTWELVSLVGNVALVEGEPFVHAHATVGDRDLRVLGGHLVRATVAVTAEVYLDPAGEALERRLDPEVKLKLLEL